MPLVPAILQALDASRTIRGLLGLNPFKVFVRVRRWSGSRVGDGSFVDNAGGADQQLTNGIQPLGPQPIMVRELSDKEVIASGGLYRDRDLKVGPITPPYTLAGCITGGFGDAAVDPLQVSTIASEVLWRVTGPGMPASGAWCDKIGQEVTAMHYYVVLRATGVQL